MLASVSGLAVRQIRARRLRALLTSFGIVLGVGMVFGVLLLSGTIRQTFDDLISSAWGSKDLIAVAQGGTLPSGDLTTISATRGVKAASAMLGGTVVRLDARGKPIKGPTGRLNIAGYDTGANTPPYDLDYKSGRPPRAGNDVAVEGNWARQRGVDLGETLTVAAASGRAKIHVVGIFEFPDGLSFGGEGTAVMPELTARALFAMPTGWHQIMIEATDRGDVATLKARLQRVLGPGVRVDTPAGIGDSFKRQLDALNIVLYFFAGVALFVGGFLILNSFSMTVAQRLRELGMLRTLGASRQMLRRSVLLEAAALGVIGSALGLLLGAGMAVGLLALIKGLGIPVGDVVFAPGSIIAAVLLGVLATLLGAWIPARRAAAVSPIAAAQGAPAGVGRASKRRIALGVALYVPGALWGGDFWFNNSNPTTLSTIGGIAMTMAMFVGMVLAAPAIITPLIGLLARPLRRIAPTGGRLAADSTRRNPGRTAATAVALTIGLSVIVVNASMSASFIGSVHDRINQTYARDVTVRPVGANELSARTISPQAVRAVKALPDAKVVSPVRLVQAELPGLHGTAHPYGLIEGVDPKTIFAVDRPEPSGLDAAQVPAALARGEILVGRAYAHTRGLRVGDRLHVAGPAASADLRIAGIYDLFNAFGGNNIRMSAAQMSRLYGPGDPGQLLLRAPAADRRAALDREIQRLVDTTHPDLEAQSTAQLKSEVDKQINQQFALFNAIVAIAVIVSLLGIINTLAMSVAERTREIGVLRALGSSRWLVRLTMLDEALLMTTAGAIAGLALGGVIAFAWVQSVSAVLPNISFHLPMGLILGVAVTAIALGLIAALLPARRAARLDVVDALAYE